MKSFAVYQKEYNVFMCSIKVTSLVNQILQSCTYILTIKGSRSAYVVDCGDPEPIQNFIEQNNKTINGVILTHSHYDHIYGLNDLIEKFPNLVVIASSKTFEGLNDVDLNMSYLYTDDDYIVHLKDNQKIVVNDGDELCILDNTLHTLYTPGHTPDCMTFEIEDCIFTGDSYNPNSPVFTKWNNSDVFLAELNERKIKEIVSKRNLKVYPGHKID